MDFGGRVPLEWVAAFWAAVIGLVLLGAVLWELVQWLWRHVTIGWAA